MREIVNTRHSYEELCFGNTFSRIADYLGFVAFGQKFSESYESQGNFYMLKMPQIAAIWANKIAKSALFYKKYADLTRMESAQIARYAILLVIW